MIPLRRIVIDFVSNDLQVLPILYLCLALNRPRKINPLTPLFF